MSALDVAPTDAPSPAAGFVARFDGPRPGAALPAPRGPLSALLLETLTSRVAAPSSEHLAAAAERAAHEPDDLARDEDAQLSLFLLYASHYGSLPGIDARHEWKHELPPSGVAAANVAHRPTSRAGIPEEEGSRAVLVRVSKNWG